ncbi:MAG: alcohol dehydrogenase catalytic domain-containing protein [Paracoccaceae bacterium]
MGYAIAISAPGGTENFRRIEIDPPRPGAGEVTVRNSAIGLNFIDVYFRTGLYPWPVERDLVTGCEAAGVIEAVGEGVDLQVGQRVAYTLPTVPYATHRAIKAAQVVPIPG